MLYKGEGDYMKTLKLSEIPDGIELQRVCPYCNIDEVQMLGEDGIDYCEGCGIVEGYIGPTYYLTENNELVIDDYHYSYKE